MKSLAALVCGALLALVTFASSAQQALLIRPLMERKVTALPDGDLYWRIENFPSRVAAEGAAGPWSLVAEAAGKVWLFTLGPKGGSSPGGERVSEVGPIARVSATQYLLRINEASGPPGSVTPVHSHPGSEAFYVLAGEQSIRGPHGTVVVEPGRRSPVTAPGWRCRSRAAGPSTFARW